MPLLLSVSPCVHCLQTQQPAQTSLGEICTTDMGFGSLFVYLLVLYVSPATQDLLGEEKLRNFPTRGS